MSLFEVISKEEYDSLARETERGEEQTAGMADLSEIPPLVGGNPSLTYCEFCKGYYIEENHVERWEGVK